MAGADIVFMIMDYTIWTLKWFWWLIIIGGLFVCKWKWSKYPIDVVIIEMRQDNLVKTNDRAGLHLDPYTKLACYKLLKSKDPIPVPEYDYMLHNKVVHTNLMERVINFLRGNVGTLFFFKYGAKQYKPIKVTVGKDVKLKYVPIKNEKGEDVMINIYHAIDPRKQFKVLDFEVVDWDNMNFMVQEQRASVERRAKKSDWVKNIAIPLAIIGGTVIFCIIMIKFGYDFAMEIKGSSTTPANTPAVAPDIPVISGILPGS